MNKPYELAAQEWEEVAAVRAVQEGFGLEDEEDPAALLAEHAFGVRFDYQTDGPGYGGAAVPTGGFAGDEAYGVYSRRRPRHLVLGAEARYSEGCGGSRLHWRPRASARCGARTGS
jgi:hypothetical protein